MWTRVCVMARCLSHHTAAAAVCGGFAAEHRAGRRYRSPVVGVMPSSSGTMATCDFEVLKKFLRNYYFASYPRRVCLYVWLYVYLLKASKKGRKSVSKSLLFLTKREQCIRNGTSETRCETQIHKKQVFFSISGFTGNCRTHVSDWNQLTDVEVCTGRRLWLLSTACCGTYRIYDIMQENNNVK